MPISADLVRPLLIAALALGLAPAAASAQSRDVVSKQIGVGRSEASLLLEFADGAELEITFEDGSVEVDGEEVGRYDAGDALDTAWRALLSESVLLDDGALALRLRDWSPPEVDGDERAAALAVDAALERELAAPTLGLTPPALPGAPNGELDRAMNALIGRPRRMLELAEAIGDLDLENVRVHVAENVTIGEDETVESSLIVVDGDLEVRGELDGSVVMVGGALRLPEGGRVTGDVRLSDARIFRDGGEVYGDVSNVRLDRERLDPDELRDEIREELRAELEDEIDIDFDGPRSFSPIGRITRALSELFASLVTLLVVAVIGGGAAVYFVRERLEVITETARRAPVRAGMVGLAGAFLTLPAWILGGLALIVTIVGILALPFWIVLFPVAVVVAAACGYLGVAQGVGEWVARQRYPKLEWVRLSNPYSTVVAGVGALSIWFVVSNLVQVIGFLGFLSGLLAVLGCMVTAAAVFVGFGAVLLTRGGRRPEYTGTGGSYWDDPWEDDLGYGGSSASTGGPSPEAPAPSAAEPTLDDEENV